MDLPSRRGFLLSLAGGSLALAAAPAGAATSASTRALAASAARTLRFSHLHTGEALTVEYFRSGHYQPDALRSVNLLLRDFRTGDVHPIDPALLDLLFTLHRAVGARRPFEVISGYRSPLTNEALRRRGEGVAAHSLHMSGRAIDIRVGDVPLATLRRTALDLRKGGVGYYPASNFVHVDTGRVRAW